MGRSRLAIDAAVGNREFRKSVEVQLHCEFYKHSMLTERSLKRVVNVSELF